MPRKTAAKTSSKPFIILEDTKDPINNRIQINSNDIKHEMICLDSVLVSNKDIIPSAASSLERERAEAASRYLVLDLIQDGETAGWLFTTSLVDDFSGFISYLCKAKEQFTKLFSDVDDTTPLQFHILPYVLKKDDYIAYKKDGVWIGMQVVESAIRSSWTGLTFDLFGRHIISDGTGFISGNSRCTVPAFSGKTTLKDLGLSKLSVNSELKKHLISRGKQYEKLHLSGPQYVAHTGSLTRRNYWFDHEYPSTGRIIIDRYSMTKMDPNYEKYFGNIGQCDSNEHGKTFVFTDDLYVITSPYCYGFSFASKQWGEMLIENISDISFRDNAFDNLILDSEIKDILFSLTKQLHQGMDIIEGKGGGCTFLLHGAPGSGKTSTAETIAETLHRPLYMVSVGELGTNVTELEEKLRNILQMASTWKAVLLIDEVDIFLEKRDLDVERNALVGVFLRLLEYYDGILFLTTNRVEQIDPAFYSRISLAIHYPDLAKAARKNIWKIQLSLYNISLPEKELDKLSGDVLNGRQIKNCVRIVHSLFATKQQTITSAEDFHPVVTKVIQFNKILDQA